MLNVILNIEYLELFKYKADRDASLSTLELFLLGLIKDRGEHIFGNFNSVGELQ